jgi:hypothetical protein
VEWIQTELFQIGVELNGAVPRIELHYTIFVSSKTGYNEMRYRVVYEDVERWGYKIPLHQSGISIENAEKVVRKYYL